nr:hypothetical protein [Candidatus Sigynarchaeota archaeon]
MKSILILDCGSRFLHELEASVISTDVAAVIRMVPARDPSVLIETRYPVLKPDDITSIHPSGVVISGTPYYLYTPRGRIPPPGFFKSLIDHAVPVLGVCGGHELLAHLISAHHSNGKPQRVIGANPSGHHEAIEPSKNPCEFSWYTDRPESKKTGEFLFASLPSRFPVWMYHIHQLLLLPPRCTVLGGTPETPIGAMAYASSPSRDPSLFGVQFHPEVSLDPVRKAIFSNFLSHCESN